MTIFLKLNHPDGNFPRYASTIIGSGDPNPFKRIVAILVRNWGVNFEYRMKFLPFGKVNRLLFSIQRIKSILTSL